MRLRVMHRLLALAKNPLGLQETFVNEAGREPNMTPAGEDAQEEWDEWYADNEGLGYGEVYIKRKDIKRGPSPSSPMDVVAWCYYTADAETIIHDHNEVRTLRAALEDGCECCVAGLKLQESIEHPGQWWHYNPNGQWWQRCELTDKQRAALSSSQESTSEA